MAVRTRPRAVYRASPEHKTHPGPWGPAQWHPRRPTIQACPTDIKDEADPQRWLDEALDRDYCWDWDGREGDAALPPYLYWYVKERGVFFKGRRTQVSDGEAVGFQYKGFPAYDWEIPVRIVEGLRTHGIIDDAVVSACRKARKLKGMKT